MLDVTARNRLQARLRQADRLAAVGTLAAGVAHEINNPLSYIIANVAYAVGVIDRMGAAGGEELAEAKQALTDASRGAERVRKIVQDLKVFARGNDERPELLDLAKVLGTALEITKNTVRHAASVQLRLETVPPVFANESQLAQVFVNLLVNAAEAIGVGQADRHRIEVKARGGPGGCAVVEVSDDGPGIAAEILPHVFDPFFTTKPIGGGSGLGLAICHGIVEALGGRIELASSLGKGTTVRVTLPPAPRTEVAAPREPSHAAAPDRRRRILIVDDEPHVLAALRRLLSREHDVETEAEGTNAVRRIAAGESFDVVLCDVMMPRMGGVELLEAVRRVRPELAQRVVFMTGGAFTDEVRAFLRASTNPFLDKPIDPERLRALVRDVAARRLARDA
jgi:nitrogen-specific signal transduction histidine kinase/ActR/RegA family two-component response regulator